MSKPIAKISGVALRPGVSKNGRYYSPEHIADAVATAQERLTSGPPMTMLTHHAAEDDSQLIAGRLTGLRVGDDGAALYDAVLADTPAGRTMLELIDTGGDGPFLEGVSIRGFWRGELRKVDVAGVEADTADALELDGLDFTKTPGVHGARVDSVARLGRGRAPSETAGGRTPIYETAEATRVQDTITETTTAPPVASVWAAPGNYHADGEPRLPLDTREQAVESFRALGTEDGARAYTETQLKRCRDRAKRALESYGIDVGPDGSFCVSLNCGQFNVSLSAHCLDPHDLDRVARAAASAAADALAAITEDPDADPIVELPMEGGKKQLPPWLKKKGKDDDEDDDDADSEDEDEDDSEDERPAKKKKKKPFESATPLDNSPAAVRDESATPQAPSGAAETTQEDTVADATPAVEATEETAEQRVERIVAERVAAEQARLAEEARIEALVAEQLAAAQAPQETEEQRVQRMVAERLAAAPTPVVAAVEAPAAVDMAALVKAAQEAAVAAVQADVARNGIPARTGLTATPGNAATVEAAPAVVPAADGLPKLPRDGVDLHLCTEAERKQMAALLEVQVMRGRSVLGRGF